MTDKELAIQKALRQAAEEVEVPPEIWEGLKKVIDAVEDKTEAD